MVSLGKAAALPLGGADAQIAGFQGQKLDGVLGVKAKGVVEPAGKFGVEADVGAVGAVIVLEQAEDGGMREELAQEESVPPAGVAKDDVGFQALAFVRGQKIEDALTANDGLIEGGRPGMAGADLREAITEQGDVRERR